MFVLACALLTALAPGSAACRDLEEFPFLVTPAGRVLATANPNEVALVSGLNRVLVEAHTGRVLEQRLFEPGIDRGWRKVPARVVSANGELACEVGGALRLSRGIAPYSLHATLIGEEDHVASHGLGWQPRTVKAVGSQICAMHSSRKVACLIAVEDGEVCFQEFQTRERIGEMYIDDDRILCLTASGALLRFECSGGELTESGIRLWDERVPNSRFTLDGSALLITDSSGAIARFNTDDGRLAWRTGLAPSVAGLTVALVGPDYAILRGKRATVCIGLKQGEELWRITDERARRPEFAYSRASGRIAAATSSEKIAIFDPNRDGVLRVARAAGNVIHELLFLTNDSLAVLEESGEVSALTFLDCADDGATLHSVALPQGNLAKATLTPIGPNSLLVVLAGELCMRIERKTTGEFVTHELAIETPIRAKANQNGGFVILDEPGRVTFFDSEGLSTSSHFVGEIHGESVDADGRTSAANVLPGVMIRNATGDERRIRGWWSDDDRVEDWTSNIRLNESLGLVVIARNHAGKLICRDYHRDEALWRDWMPSQEYKSMSLLELGGPDNSLLLCAGSDRQFCGVRDLATGEWVGRWPLLGSARSLVSRGEYAERCDFNGRFVVVGLEPIEVRAQMQVFEDGSLFALSEGRTLIEEGAAARSVVSRDRLRAR